MMSFILNPLGKYALIWYVIYFSSLPQKHIKSLSVKEQEPDCRRCYDCYGNSSVLKFHIPSLLLLFIFSFLFFAPSEPGLWFFKSPISSSIKTPWITPPLKGGFDPAHVGRSPREPVLISFDLDACVHLGTARWWCFVANMGYKWIEYRLMDLMLPSQHENIWKPSQHLCLSHV